MTEASLATLPSELWYRIFNHLDADSIMFSVRLVCQRLYQITDGYPDYEIDVDSKSTFHLERIVRRIPPENITSLILRDKSHDSARMRLFFSLIDINRLTHLRSVTLFAIKKTQEYGPIIQLPVSNLVSLRIHSDIWHGRDATSAFISSAMARTTLKRLHLIQSDYTITNISWSSPCNIKRLTIKSCSWTEYNIILQRLPHLQTFVTAQFLMNRSMVSSGTHARYRKLMSLSIGDTSSSMADLRELLSLTPSLVVFRLRSHRSELDSVIDGSDWAHLIQTHLLGLRSFHFYFTYHLRQENNAKDLELIIDPFRTPFWLHEKKWIVTCDYILRDKVINLFTAPRDTLDFGQPSPTNIKLQFPSLTMRFDPTSMDLSPHPKVHVLHVKNDRMEPQVCNKNRPI